MYPRTPRSGNHGCCILSLTMILLPFACLYCKIPISSVKAYQNSVVFSQLRCQRDSEGNGNIWFNFSSSFPYRKRGWRVLMLHKIFFSRCQFPSFTSCKNQKKIGLVGRLMWIIWVWHQKQDHKEHGAFLCSYELFLLCSCTFCLFLWQE